MTTVAEQFALLPHENVYKKTDFFCGVEYEIESIAKISDKVKQAFVVEIDNSLRNGGREFKTPPVQFAEAMKLFDLLHAGIAFGEHSPYSTRTSTHVHVNVSHFQCEQLRQFVLAYALLEPLFFHFVGEDRQNNIYCVPLNYTYMPSIYKDDLVGMRKKWHKYTAFNLKPIMCEPECPGLGTVEFRHLYGTNDRTIFVNWLSAIKELYDFINIRPTYNIITEIETGKTANQFAQEMCPTLAQKLAPYQINLMCKDTMLDVKLSVGGLSEKKETKPRKSAKIDLPPMMPVGFVHDEVQF